MEPITPRIKNYSFAFTVINVDVNREANKCPKTFFKIASLTSAILTYFLLRKSMDIYDTMIRHLRVNFILTRQENV